MISLSIRTSLFTQAKRNSEDPPKGSLASGKIPKNPRNALSVTGDTGTLLPEPYPSRTYTIEQSSVPLTIHSFGTDNIDTKSIQHIKNTNTTRTMNKGLLQNPECAFCQLWLSLTEELTPWDKDQIQMHLIHDHGLIMEKIPT